MVIPPTTKAIKNEKTIRLPSKSRINAAIILQEGVGFMLPKLKNYRAQRLLGKH
jgi:hypothetical protein